MGVVFPAPGLNRTGRSPAPQERECRTNVAQGQLRWANGQKLLPNPCASLGHILNDGANGIPDAGMLKNL
jgi:hypothetical protein